MSEHPLCISVPLALGPANKNLANPLERNHGASKSQVVPSQAKANFPEIADSMAKSWPLAKEAEEGADSEHPPTRVQMPSRAEPGFGLLLLFL